MLTSQTILGYVKAEPFRPFRLHLASGRTLDVRHPEMIKVLKSSVLIFKATGDSADLPDEWESVPLMLTESISHIEASALSAHEHCHRTGAHVRLHQGVGDCSQELLSRMDFAE